MPAPSSRRAKSREHIKTIFDAVTRIQGEQHGKVFARAFGIGPRASENWPIRGIPEVYWPEVSRLSGHSLDTIDDAHEPAE